MKPNIFFFSQSVWERSIAQSLTATHYENTSIQIYWKFHQQKKKWKFADTKFWYFSYFYSKHRLWAQSMFLSRNKKNNVYPTFTAEKWGLRGSKLYRYVFVMSSSMTTRGYIFVIWSEKYWGVNVLGSVFYATKKKQKKNKQKKKTNKQTKKKKKKKKKQQINK